MLDLHINIHERAQITKERGMRYTDFELDVAAYDFMTAGSSSYQYKRRNMSMPCIKTVKKHISSHTEDTREGVLMIDPLVKYLTAHGYPMKVVLSEDGTPVSPNPEYDPRSDSIRGLVAPLNEKGMPMEHMFEASSVVKIMEDLDTYTVGEYLYTVFATPLFPKASPFCILYMCTDNKFTHEDVLRRWRYIETELAKVGITVVANASDGDPRLLTAMKVRTGLPREMPCKLYGPHFVAELGDDALCIQDTIHLINKLRHSLLDPKKHMYIGKYTIASSLLKQMMDYGHKSVHKLNPSDLNHMDKMKFDPSSKLMSPDLIEHLHEVVPGSNGTVAYLKVMRLIHESFLEENVSPTERITAIWTALFFIRAWRSISLRNTKNIKQCPTSNVYWSLELNAHGIVQFLIQCRDNRHPEQFNIQIMSSQPCETSFRELRSMTTLNHTAVNFTMKEVEQRMQKVQMKLLIMYRRRNLINFPSLLRQDQKVSETPVYDLPNDNEICNAILEAENNATNLLIFVGCTVDEISFSNNIVIQNSKTIPDFQFVDTSAGTEWNDENDVANHQENGSEEAIEEENFSPSNVTDAENIETAESIFNRAGGELVLRNCESLSKSHAFKLKGVNGKIVYVKKSTMLWLLTSGRFRRSNDRLRRFHQIRMTNSISMSENCIKEEVSIGDWVALSGRLICHVSSFQFQTGRSKACSLQAVPVDCPSNVERRGISVFGNFYYVSKQGRLSLCNERHRQMDITDYRAHIVGPNNKPGVDTLILPNQTIVFLKSLKVI